MKCGLVQGPVLVLGCELAMEEVQCGLDLTVWVLRLSAAAATHPYLRHAFKKCISELSIVHSLPLPQVFAMYIRSSGIALYLNIVTDFVGVCLL